jgi:peptide/nickel transport system permease protein
MAPYVVRRLLLVVPVMLIVSLLSFSLILLVPGDPAVTIAGQSATREQIAAIRETLGLDRPLVVQYLSWLGHAVTGDFGTSLSTQQPVVGSILDRLPVMLSLAGGALVVAVLLGFPAGVAAAVRRDGLVDRLLGIGAATGLALPSYFVGMLLIIVVALNLGWLPPTGYTPLATDPADWLAHIVLPCIALGLVPAAVLARQLRGAMVTALDQDYVRTADAKGLLRQKVVYKHALKNAAIAPLTALGTQFALVVGGSVVVEQVFGIPGLGALAVNAVQNRDIPLIQGIVVFTALMVQAINLLVDVSYGWLNPRVRVAAAR